jgi:hypothetical protein
MGDAPNRLRYLADHEQTGRILTVSLNCIFTYVAAQFTAFDGVIIAASMSSCAARRASLML